jgi:hypothetical protein
MLPAIGAASLALDAIQSLTSSGSSSSSQPVAGFGPALSSNSDSSATPAGPATIRGFSSTQISSGNISALLDAQSLTSGNTTDALGAGGSTPDSFQTQAASASSAYNAIGQLTHSTAIPLGFSPLSVSA